MSMTTAQTDQGGDPLNRLVNREEVLQCCRFGIVSEL